MKEGKLLVAMMVIVCCSCNNRLVDYEVETSPFGHVYSTSRELGVIEVSENEFFMIQIVPTVVSVNSKNKFIVVNHTRYELYWNTLFTLEYYQANRWIPVPIEGDWINVGYELSPGEIFSNETIVANKTLFTLVNEFNKGLKGRYRITHKVTIIEIGSYDSAREFEII